MTKFLRVPSIENYIRSLLQTYMLWCWLLLATWQMILHVRITKNRRRKIEQMLSMQIKNDCYATSFVISYTVYVVIFAVVFTFFYKFLRVRPRKKFPLQFMSIYSNENIRKITKLTPREFLHLVQNHENICTRKLWRIQYVLSDDVRPKKKNCYVALTRPKSENWVGRSIFF